MIAGEVVRGRELAAPVYAKVDVVIVGSGAGGAVVARELSRAGLSVVVLEEGGHYTPEEYGAMSPSNTIRRLGREAGLSAACASASPSSFSRSGRASSGSTR